MLNERSLKLFKKEQLIRDEIINLIDFEKYI